MAARLVLGENEFEIIQQIGAGSYGKVYKAIDHQRQREVAIKCMLLDSERYGLLCVVVREINLLLDLKHPNIVHLHDIIRRDQEIFLVLEYMDTDLYRYLLRHPRPLKQLQVKVYFYQLLNGLEYCHRHQSLLILICQQLEISCPIDSLVLLVFHRDLKPQNLLLDAKGTLKIADFGLARDANISKRAYSKEIITLWYRPPEILLGADRYSSAVDIWSAGCIFAEMLRTAPLFKGDCEIAQLFRIFQILGTPDDTLWPGVTSFPYYTTDFPRWSSSLNSLKNSVHLINEKAEDLLVRCLFYIPEKRLTAKQALEHPYFHQDNEQYGLLLS